MNIPQSLTINGITWRIWEVEPGELEVEHICGDSNPEIQLIRINKSLSQEMKEVTMLHELLHCLNNEMDHEVVEMLSQTLWQVLSQLYENQETPHF